MTAHVPIVDLADWQEGEKGRARLAKAVDEALSSLGFMQVLGHAIPAPVLAAMLSETAQLFALPLASKRELVPPDPRINRGYAPLGSEALSYSLGIEAPHPDLFEAFNIGLDEVPDAPFYRDAPHGFFAPNLWPRDLPALRPALNDYLSAAAGVALTLTDVFALALGLPDRWFRPFVDRSTLTLRVNHYERREGEPNPGPGQMRMGPHTDYGVLTVLYADPVVGLQIMTPDGVWLDVVPERSALLVNLGDLTAEWTNDRWLSTLHRVVCPPSTGPVRRRSAALFFDGNYDAEIECLTTCTSATHPPRYPRVVAGEHLMAKILGPRHLRPSGGLDTVRRRLSGP